MKKIIIIGIKGMAGHVIYNYFKEETSYEVIGVARDESLSSPDYNADITDFDKLETILTNEKPDVIVNCIGILNKNAEDYPDHAILLNSYFPHFLTKVGKEVGFKVIHISTDCVFNGKSGGYEENSIKDGFGFYAQSKALGEINYGNNLTLRTSIIGPELNINGIGLFHWFMLQSGTIYGYSQAFWTGVTTIELAKAIRAAIENNISGLHHLVNNGKISKLDLVNLFKQVFEKNELTILSKDDYIIDKSLVKTNFDFDYVVPSYGDMIKEMKVWIDSHPSWYRRYFEQ